MVMRPIVSHIDIYFSFILGDNEAEPHEHMILGQFFFSKKFLSKYHAILVHFKLMRSSYLPSLFVGNQRKCSHSA